MIDAGSTGSRVYLYEHDAKTIKLLDKMRVEPGLSSFHNNVNGIQKYLEPLIAFSKKLLPEGVEPKNVSITLQATGGLRALSNKNQKAVIAKAQKVLAASEFKEAQAEVISGATEGVYQWTAINYLLGNFDNPKKHTFGLVEMGGASLQVTFLNHEPLLPGRYEPQLYSKSYDGFGETWAWNKYGSKACKNIPLDYKACRRFVAKHITVLHKPKLQGDFYLVDNFEQLATLLNLKKVSSNILDELGPANCLKSLERLKLDLPFASEHYLSKICFDTAYMSVVLEKLGFARERELIATREIANTALSWTLGSLLNRLSSLKPPSVP